jgi:aspartate/methionine/tyrosine aminotransferase
VKALLARGLSEKTAALYINTPCNPVGNVLSRAMLEQVGAFAKEHDLWIVSDEAYEDFIFSRDRHVSMATLEGLKDRTVSIFTFSKCLAASGYRVGYATAHPEVIHRIHRASTHTLYNAPTDNQQLVAQALVTWDEWFPALYESYKENRDLVCDGFKGRFYPPNGSFYCFFNASESLAGRPPMVLLEEMVRNGVAAVPGRAFGKGLESWFRFCFVAVPRERLILGLHRLNRALETV